MGNDTCFNGKAHKMEKGTVYKEYFCEHCGELEDSIELKECREELSSLRTQLAAEIEKREKAEMELSRFKKGNPQELDRLVECALCKSGADFVYTIKCAGDEIIYICTGCAGKTVVQAIEKFPELQQRADTAEQALQKSEAEKVELERVCPHCKWFSSSNKGMDCQPMQSGALDTWPEGLKACPNWTKAEAIIERGD